MTDTRHALVLATAMAAVGLLQGQFSHARPGHCRAGDNPAAGPSQGFAANQAADPGTGRCTPILQATDRLATRH